MNIFSEITYHDINLFPTEPGINQGQVKALCASVVRANEALGSMRRTELAIVSRCPDLIEPTQSNAKLIKQALSAVTNASNLVWLVTTDSPRNIGQALPACPNVCIGVTIDNANEADKKIVELRAIRAPYRALLIRSTVGPIDMTGQLDGIDWLVCDEVTEEARWWTSLEAVCHLSNTAILRPGRFITDGSLLEHPFGKKFNLRHPTLRGLENAFDKFNEKVSVRTIDSEPCEPAKVLQTVAVAGPHMPDTAATLMIANEPAGDVEPLLPNETQEEPTAELPLSGMSAETEIVTQSPSPAKDESVRELDMAVGNTGAPAPPELVDGDSCLMLRETVTIDAEVVSPDEVLAVEMTDEVAQVEKLLADFSSLTDTQIVVNIAKYSARAFRLARQAEAMALRAIMYARASGALLNEAKKRCKHGEFKSWMKKHMKPKNVSERTCQRHMQLAKKIPDFRSLTEGGYSGLRDAYITLGIIPAAKVPLVQVAEKDEHDVAPDATLRQATSLLKAVSALQKCLRHFIATNERLNPQDTALIELGMTEISTLHQQLRECPGSETE
jgi:hypothetical protein